MAGLTRSDDGWRATSYASVCAVLESPALGVPEVPPSAAVGTIVWLRASVSRFCNGAAHDERRAKIVALLDRIDPSRLGDEAHRRADTSADDRHVVCASLAAQLGAADPDSVADAVLDCAAAYFPGADDEVVRRGDTATRQLVELLHDEDVEVVVARIAVLVQACDATAQLIEATRQHRDSPPVRVMRRVAQEDVTIDGTTIERGDIVLCDIVQASRETDELLTFGHGLRACPGVAQAQALVAGVLSRG
jgi:hypothetical protein